ncbi:hypothetical protein GCM10010331_74690 [Streptomyces xanthochromogenes]|uniref:hypothetical protein n=1 Tax=Streptomyces xanthochromogenes TaxID=67384 RepID=UPI0016798E6C|nr:hypothetical protein [Streptomyces xanthochromogenes]GHB75901.1 hypothetical protein GCM10010331_74690 [Streptomyces xanthochromogenes]
MSKQPPAPGQMPAPKSPAEFLSEHRAYAGTTVAAGTLLTLARIWNAQGAEHSVGAAGLMLAFGAASGYLAVKSDEETASAVFSSMALTFGALSVGVYSDPIAPALIIWIVAVIASSVLIARSRRDDRRVATQHAAEMAALKVDRSADITIAEIDANSRIEVARQQSAAAAAMEEAIAHRAALADGPLDPTGMLRASGQLPPLHVVKDTDDERRTA